MGVIVGWRFVDRRLRTLCLYELGARRSSSQEKEANSYYFLFSWDSDIGVRIVGIEAAVRHFHNYPTFD